MLAAQGDARAPRTVRGDVLSNRRPLLSSQSTRQFISCELVSRLERRTTAHQAKGTGLYGEDLLRSSPYHRDYSYSQAMLLRSEISNSPLAHAPCPRQKCQQRKWLQKPLLPRRALQRARKRSLLTKKTQRTCENGLYQRSVLILSPPYT